MSADYHFNTQLTMRNPKLDLSKSLDAHCLQLNIYEPEQYVSLARLIVLVLLSYHFDVPLVGLA